MNELVCTLTRLSAYGVNELVQARRTFNPDEISDLAHSIAQYGLIEPIGIVDYSSERRFDLLVSELNKVWSVKKDPASYKPIRIGRKKVWRVLIFGACRVRAMIWLSQNVCQKCAQSDDNDRIQHGCIHRHFSDCCMDAKLYNNLTPQQFLDLQFNENSYHPILPGELAEGVSAYYRYLLLSKSDVTIAQAARRLGRNESTVRNALLFATLPQYIRTNAQNSGRYGIALAIAGYRDFAEKKDTHVSSRELCDMFTYFQTRGMTLSQIREYIKDKQNSIQQLNLLSIMEEVQVQSGMQLKRDLSRKATEFLYKGLAFWSNILTLCRTQRLCKQHTPLSEETLLRLLNIHAQVLQRVLRHLARIKPSQVERAQFADGVFQKTVEVTQRLLEYPD